MQGGGKKEPAGCRPKDTQRRRGSTPPEDQESTPNEDSGTFSINWKKFTENLRNYTQRIPFFRRPRSPSARDNPHSVARSTTPSAYADPELLGRCKSPFFGDTENEKQMSLICEMGAMQFLYYQCFAGSDRASEYVTLLQKVTKSLSAAGSKLRRTGTDVLNKFRSESKSGSFSEHKNTASEQRHSSLPIHLDPVPARRESRRQSQPVRQVQQSHVTLRSPNLPSASGALFQGPSTSARCEILRETPGTPSESEHRRSLPIFEKVRKRPERSLSEYSEVVGRRHDLRSSGFHGCDGEDGGVHQVLSRRNFQFCGLPPPRREKSSSESSSDDRSSLSSRQRYPLRRQDAIDEENPPASSLQDINTRGFSEELVRRPRKKKSTKAHCVS